MQKVQEYKNQVISDCGFNRFDAEGVIPLLLIYE